MGGGGGGGVGGNEAFAIKSVMIVFGGWLEFLFVFSSAHTSHTLLSHAHPNPFHHYSL